MDNVTNSEIQRGLGRVEGKVDLIISRMDSQDSKIVIQDSKIEGLQKKVYSYSAVISLVMSGLTAMIAHYFKG